MERLNKCTQDKTALAAAIAHRCAEDDAQHEVRAMPLGPGHLPASTKGLGPAALTRTPPDMEQ